MNKYKVVKYNLPYDIVSYESMFEHNGKRYKAQVFDKKTGSININVYDDMLYTCSIYDMESGKRLISTPIKYNSSINYGVDEFYNRRIDECIDDFIESDICPQITDNEMYIIKVDFSDISNIQFINVYVPFKGLKVKQENEKKLYIKVDNLSNLLVFNKSSNGNYYTVKYEHSSLYFISESKEGCHKLLEEYINDKVKYFELKINDLKATINNYKEALIRK